jgi:dolichol-phosphate mannosyltransferase
MDGHPGGAGRPLSLVIPAYNEEGAIGQAIAEADEALQRLGVDYEILIVDDGSRDRTAEIVAAAAENRSRVRLLRHGENKGYGAALRTGFEAACFPYVAFTDADCQLDLADLALLLPLADRYPVVAGYRVDRKDPALRRFLSWGYNLLARRLLGTRVRDCDCALKIFRRDCLDRLMPEARGFFVNTEMLSRARQLGYGVAEVGVRHRPRLRGQSKVSFWDVPRTLKSLLPFWWSRVLFPGPATGSSGTASTAFTRRSSALLGLVLVAAGLLFFARLRNPLLEPEEARYAEIPRQMMTEGHFLVPTLHGQPYYHKPPLLYWLVMGSYSLFGVEDWAARLVPCLAGFLTVLVAFCWGHGVLGKRAAFIGSLILCLSARFIYLGRMLTLDSLLCLWVISALAAAHVSLRSERLSWSWWLLSACCCGLGILTKGPVAIILVAVPILLFVQLNQRSRQASRACFLIYLATAALVAAPWYLLTALYDSSFLGFFLWTHNVVRYVAPYDHPRPIWFYLPDVLLGMFPWSLLLPSLTVYLFRQSRVLAAHRPPAVGFCLLASLTCLCFFSASGCKRAGYILPVFPTLALALGGYTDAVLPRRGMAGGGLGSRVSRMALGRLAAWATLAGLAVGGVAALVAVAAGLCKPATGLALAVLAALTFTACCKLGGSFSPEASWASCCATTFILLLLAVHQVLPGYARKFSLRKQARTHFEMARAGDRPVVCYPHGWDSVTFYLRRRDVKVYGSDEKEKLIADLRAHPDTLLFVKSDDQADRSSKQCLSDLLRELPPSLEFVPQGRPGIATAGTLRRRRLPPDMLLAEN